MVIMCHLKGNKGLSILEVSFVVCIISICIAMFYSLKCWYVDEYINKSISKQLGTLSEKIEEYILSVPHEPFGLSEVGVAKKIPIKKLIESGILSGEKQLKTLKDGEIEVYLRKQSSLAGSNFDNIDILLFIKPSPNTVKRFGAQNIVKYLGAGGALYDKNKNVYVGIADQWELSPSSYGLKFDGDTPPAVLFRKNTVLRYGGGAVDNVSYAIYSEGVNSSSDIWQPSRLNDHVAVTYRVHNANHVIIKIIMIYNGSSVREFLYNCDVTSGYNEFHFYPLSKWLSGDYPSGRYSLIIKIAPVTTSGRPGFAKEIDIPLEIN